MQNHGNNLPKVRTEEVSAGEQGQRVDNFLLKRAPGVPRSHIYKLIRSGQVRVNGGRIKATRKLQCGDLVRIPPIRTANREAVRVPDDLAARLAARVIIEHDDFLGLDKPAGLAVHAGSGLPFGAIDAIRQARGEPQLELAHRLDRGTSGCMLIARNIGVNRELQALFRSRDVFKRYAVLVDGVWSHGDRTVTAPLAKNQEHAGERRVMVSSDGQTAVSNFSVQQTFADASELLVHIETGRTHQIRVHALHCGHAVIGDTRYGGNGANARYRKLGLARMYLHARSLEFEWRGDKICVDAPVDDDWQRAVAKLAAE